MKTRMLKRKEKDMRMRSMILMVFLLVCAINLQSQTVDSSTNLLGQDNFDDAIDYPNDPVQSIFHADPNLKNCLVWQIESGQVKVGTPDVGDLRNCLSPALNTPTPMCVVTTKSFTLPYEMGFNLVQAYVQANPAQGAVVMYQDMNNYYRIQMASFELRIYRVMDGNTTLIGSSASLGIAWGWACAKFKIRAAKLNDRIHFECVKSDFVRYTNPSQYDTNAYSWSTDDIDMQAVNRFGTGRIGFCRLVSGSSEEVGYYDNISVKYYYNGSDTVAPNTPQNVTTSFVSNTHVNLTWTTSTDAMPGSGIEKYSVWRNGDSISSVQTNSFDDIGLKSNTPYIYTIYAHDAAGNKSQGSMPLSVTTLSSPPQAVPQNLNFITQNGITWTFDKQYPCGQFANGDYWVVGPVLITSISPAPQIADGRAINGSMVNPQVSWDQGFDNAMEHIAYNPNLNVGLALPSLTIQAGSSLLSSVSRTQTNDQLLDRICILTILSQIPAEGSFRPSYCGTNKLPLLNKNYLDYKKLGNLEPVGMKENMKEMEAKFRFPCIDYILGWVCNGYLNPINSFPGYGREYADLYGYATLLLNCEFTELQKESLLVKAIQTGIDNYGIIQAGGKGWAADGGHMSGRLWPILFAGIMLNDSSMKAISSKIGDYAYTNGHNAVDPPQDYIHFGETDQTFYVSQTNVDLTNSAQWDPDHRVPVQPYNPSDIGLPEWGINHIPRPYADNRDWGAIYRWGCTGGAWPGEILSSLIMNAKSLWNHNVLFDYMDRYLKIQEECNDPFAKSMWERYRNNYGPVWHNSDLESPSVPLNFRVTAINTRNNMMNNNLSWDASTDNVGVLDYEIFRDGYLLTITPTTTYADTGLNAGTHYSYSILAFDAAGNKSTQFPSSSNIAEHITMPGEFTVSQNYPNPFNPSTKIQFVVPSDGHVRIRVYNCLGQIVATLFEGEAKAGKYQTVQIDGSNLSSGVYFYSIEHRGQRIAKQMVLIK